MKYRKTLIAAGAIGALVLVFLLLFEWNWFRAPIERYVFKKTGRHLKIEGDIKVVLGFPPTIRIGKLRYENPEWSQEKRMGAVEDLEFVPNLRSLFGPVVIIERLRVVNADVLLERSKDGKRNWVFGRADDPEAPAPEIRSLTIDHGVIRWRDGLEDLEARAEVKTEAQDVQGQPQRLPTVIAFSGIYKNLPFSGSARTGSVLGLRDSGVAFPLQARGKIGKTSFEIDGTFVDIGQLAGVDARVKIAGPDWSRLYPIVPVPLPHSPPYSIEGRFKNQGAQYAYENFKGIIGGSDIDGTAVFTPKQPRPHLAASFHSKILDLKDLGPMIGIHSSGAADAERGTVSSERGKPEAVAASARVLPKEPFRLERLNAIDADVTLKAGQIRRPEGLALEDLTATLKLADGALTLEPLNFGFAGGNIVSNITLNAKQDPIVTQATISMRALRLNKLFPTVQLMKESEGAMGARIKISGRGNSIAAMLASANGEGSFATSGGAVSNLLVEFFGLDGGEIIKFLVVGDRETAIRCGAASFDVKDGLATSRSLVLDTADTQIEGAGTVNLRDEQLDITLKPHPKDVSILVVRSPIHIVGSFANPDVSVDKGGLVRRLGSAALLGLINPLAALIPLVETGTGTDANCVELLATVEAAQREAVKPPSKPVAEKPRKK
ncbi:MAG TPA: AsmA family protein [Geopsychrobacteraceae bacterium]